MVKVMVVCDSLFGNTRQVAESIVAGMKGVAEIDAVIQKPKEVDLGGLAGYDIILIGSPNHMGGATMAVRRFIGKLGKLALKGKAATVFDTCGGGETGKAVAGMEKRVAKKAPGLKLMTPGLSVHVKGLKGPIVDGELARSERFGAELAGRLKKA